MKEEEGIFFFSSPQLLLGAMNYSQKVSYCLEERGKKASMFCSGDPEELSAEQIDGVHESRNSTNTQP